MASETDVRRRLRKVKDPELNLDIVVLGLIYDIDISEDYVHVTMSLTSPMCPAAGQIVEDAKKAIEELDDVSTADIELTFEPPWSPERIDPLIRSSLGI